VFFSLRVASCNFVLAICKDTKFSGDLQEKGQLFSSELSYLTFALKMRSRHGLEYSLRLGLE
jgi:hypothetical protein